MIDVYGLGTDFVTENTLDGIDPGTNCWHGEDLKFITVMQFTGMKDQNGKVIYEGDILQTCTDKALVVSWSNKYASFVLNRNGWAFSHWFGESCEADDCIIIGNIHENPELLKEVKDGD